MRHSIVGLGLVALVVTVASASAYAQTTAPRSAEEIRASYETHKGEFDYLLGDWEFTADSKEYGTFRGFWSAVRLATGQILDEYRIVDDNGRTIYATSTLRNYNGALDRWELVGVGAGNGIQDMGTGRRVGDEVQIEQRFGVMSAAPSTWKIRYYDIRPDRFSWSADRSTDGGKTWVAKHQTIEARRVGPARSLGPLATGKAAAAGASVDDPITGSWGSDSETLLELRHDGAGRVTGTVIWRADGRELTRAPIAAGTFDPSSGALKLEGEAKRPDTGQMARYLIQGRLDKGTLAGTYAFADHDGHFSFTRR